MVQKARIHKAVCQIKLSCRQCQLLISILSVAIVKLTFHILRVVFYSPISCGGMPCMWFLFVNVRLCFRFPSDSVSRLTPLSLANGSYYQARSGFTPYSNCPCRANKEKTPGFADVLSFCAVTEPLIQFYFSSLGVFKLKNSCKLGDFCIFNILRIF